MLSNIVKIVATRYHIFRKKATKFDDFGWGSAHAPVVEAHSSPRNI